MKKWFEISNKGTMDINLATIIGFTTKRDDDSKVGNFGSGLKYSIPYMLRNNIDFKCFVGGKELVYGRETIEGYRNGEVHKTDVMTVNGERTGISLDVGPDWKKWFVVREIVQNAFDEEEFNTDFVDDFTPVDGYTKWYLSYSDFREIVLEYDNYFSFERKPIADIEFKSSCWWTSGPMTLKVFPKLMGKEEKSRIYYKGFYVGQIANSKYDYELSEVRINEYRMIANDYDVTTNISTALMSHASSDLVTEFFGEGMEEDFIWDETASCRHNEAMEAFIVDNKLNFTNPWATFGKMADGISAVAEESQKLSLTTKQHAYFTKWGWLDPSQVKFKDGLPPMEEVSVPNDAQALIDEAVEFIESRGWILYPIETMVIHEDSKKSVLGMADLENKTIILTSTLLNNPEYGLDMYILTLLEEQLHIDSGKGDFTREFQNAIFGKMYHFMKMIKTPAVT